MYLLTIIPSLIQGVYRYVVRYWYIGSSAQTSGGFNFLFQCSYSPANLDVSNSQTECLNAASNFPFVLQLTRYSDH